MYKSTRTIFNVALETSKMLGTPYNVMSGTTLNDKYEINVPISATSLPKVQYYGIGLHYGELLNGTAIEYEQAVHNPTDGNVFIPIPFIIREVNVGFTSTEYANYRMIVKKEINGIEYIMAYLKKLDSIDTNSTIYRVNKSDTYSIDKLEDTNINVMSPIPKHNIDILPEELTYVAHSQKVHIVLNYIEAQEIKNVIDIISPNVSVGNLYEIGEIMLVSGVEGNYKGRFEVGAAQAAFFIRTSLIVNTLQLDSDDTLEESVDIGGMTPFVLRA